MSTKPQFITVPQIIRDECPLPEGCWFDEETNTHYARLYNGADNSYWCWIDRGIKIIINSHNRPKEYLPPETTDEELWRYVYAQFILGDHDG